MKNIKEYISSIEGSQTLEELINAWNKVPTDLLDKNYKLFFDNYQLKYKELTKE